MFSYNHWNINLYNNLPCLTGDMLNYYLNKADDIIHIEKSNASFTPGWNYHSMGVYDGFKTTNVPNPTPIILMDLNTGVPNSWNNNDYYEYFRHTYRIFESKIVIIDDPNCQ